METIRTFIAIALPESVIRQLAQVQRQLERQAPPESVRWVKPEGIHLTLKFLGDTPVGRLDAIRAALAAVAAQASPCVFTVGGLGCFPNARKPRVIWVGVQAVGGELAALQRAVEAAMKPLGFPPEGRDFTPHLTLGRVRDRIPPADLSRLGALVSSADIGTLGEVHARGFALIQSVLKPSGAEYTPLAEFLMGGS
ncbi:MAG: RNA 2',3'-cyclic phosphodiesterase [Thermoflexales bacterium]|nr:RNA 2',3'-cyclic phosphodiesterase [Thermoflexales bacterium]